MKREDEKETITVNFYSGYKEGETPRSLIFRGREYPVEKIFWRKRVSEASHGKAYELFECQVGGKRVKIRKDESGLGEVISPLDLP